MKVWNVTGWVQYEGHDDLGVFSNLPASLQCKEYWEEQVREDNVYYDDITIHATYVEDEFVAPTED